MQGGAEPDVEGSDEESDDTLNVIIGSKMSPNNRCDYRLFKCIDAAGDTRLMAIVDAKKTIDVHAIAQLVGYYSRSDVSIPPPVLIVMSSTQMQVQQPIP